MVATLTPPATGHSRDDAGRKPRRPGKTTPAKFTIVIIGLVMMIVGNAFAAVSACWTRADTLRQVTDRWAPMSVVARQVYASLSDASVTATIAFLAGESASPQLRQRYDANVAQAGSALAKAASEAGVVIEARPQIDVLSKQVPVYTGLVEAARANGRLGMPVGAAYLRQSDELMRSEILPAARELHRIYSDRVKGGQDSASGLFSWLVTVPAVVLLIILFSALIYLASKTKRLVNGGLLLAVLAVAAGAAWSVMGTVTSGAVTQYAMWAGSAPVDMIVQARTDVMTSRTDEVLALVTQREGANYEQRFAGLGKRLLGTENEPGPLPMARALAADPAAAKPLDDAMADLQAWLSAHEQIRTLEAAGKHAEAVELAVGAAQTGAAGSVDSLTAGLDIAIKQAADANVGVTSEARNLLTWPMIGTVVLTLLAIVATMLGIGRRIREYR